MCCTEKGVKKFVTGRGTNYVISHGESHGKTDSFTSVRGYREATKRRQEIGM